MAVTLAVLPAMDTTFTYPGLKLRKQPGRARTTHARPRAASKGTRAANCTEGGNCGSLPAAMDGWDDVSHNSLPASVDPFVVEDNRSFSCRVLESRSYPVKLWFPRTGTWKVTSGKKKVTKPTNSRMPIADRSTRCQRSTATPFPDTHCSTRAPQNIKVRLFSPHHHIQHVPRVGPSITTYATGNPSAL